MILTLLSKSENDLMVNTHIFWYKGLAKSKEQSQVWTKMFLFRKNSSSDEKVVFHQRVKKSMEFVFDKCVLNVTPVTNPTQYTKSDE